MCIGRMLPNGCQEDDECIDRDVNIVGSLCPGICPVYCEDDWIAVSGGIGANGCQSSPVCVRKYKLSGISQ